MKFTVTVTKEVSEDRIANLLVGAWEGGSNYWAEANGSPWKDDPQVEHGLRLNLPVMVYDYLELGSHRKVKHILDRKAIQSGLELCIRDQPTTWAEIDQENDDANTADIFLQLCLFGEVRYG